MTIILRKYIFKMRARNTVWHYIADVLKTEPSDSQVARQFWENNLNVGSRKILFKHPPPTEDGPGLLKVIPDFSFSTS